MDKFRTRASIWMVVVFTVLHALTCVACRSLGVEDTQVLTLLTLAMVFVLCYQGGFKIYFTLVALVLVNVLAYLIGNALPTLLDGILGETMWVHVLSTSLTTLVLGGALVAALRYLADNPAFSGPKAKNPPRTYRVRWIVRLSNRIVPVMTDQIACFFSEDKSNYLMTFDGERYIVDATMETISEEVDPERFFRINRSCILALRSIESAVVSDGRYTVEVHPSPGNVSLTVTRSREHEFLRWLEKS